MPKKSTSAPRRTRGGAAAPRGRRSNKASDKRSGSAKSGAEAGRINASTVRQALAAGQRSWMELLKALDAEPTARRKQLRQVVKGLIRNDEIAQDGKGNYELITAGVSGSKETDERSRDLPEQVIGVLTLETRYPYVEALSPSFKGKVFLSEAGGRRFAHGDTVSVRIVDEDRHGPKGELVARIARGGGAAQAAETLLASYEVPQEWPEAMAAVVAKLPSRVASASHRGREDLRDVPLVTIDGITAKDFDDAVYAERVGRGWRLLVAIADVAHYVGAGSVLDEEAQLRGNSVYLPDRVIPMLPEELSNGLCSLRPDENRLAMVCDMRISQAGHISKHRFYPAVIRSWARLTYEQVGGYLAGESLAQQAPVLKSLDTLHALYQTMRDEREQRGALDFSGREANVRIEDDRPVAVDPVQRNDAHRLIEEAMIAANVCAARTLEKAHLHGMYRVHEPPGVEKTEQLRQALAVSGIRLPKGELSSKVVQQALQGLAKREHPWLLEGLVLRALSQARYTPQNKGHFGLALPRYMHFTSPIRRYADLLVHRGIKAMLAMSADEVPARLPRGAHIYDTDQLLQLGEQISATERRADEVSWGVDAWLKCEFMAEHVGEDLDGIVAAVTEFGLFVELEGYFVQGLVHISELGKDYFQFQAQTMSLLGERSGRRFSLGQQLKVHVVSVNPPKGRIELVLAGGNDAGRKKAGRRKRS
ncbi:MAG: ribonuclease R [Pseudomonadales bacterium]